MFGVPLVPKYVKRSVYQLLTLADFDTNIVAGCS